MLNILSFSWRDDDEDDYDDDDVRIIRAVVSVVKYKLFRSGLIVRSGEIMERL